MRHLVKVQRLKSAIIHEMGAFGQSHALISLSIVFVVAIHYVHTRFRTRLFTKVRKNKNQFP